MIGNFSEKNDSMKFLITIIFAIISIRGFSQNTPEPVLNTGDEAPPFIGIDQYGHKVDKDSLLRKGPVVLVFYRGNWCPYCRKHLKDLQDSLQLILNEGASVIVVTPEKPESIQKMISKTGAAFSILHDEHYTIMNDYGVAFTITEKTVPRYYNSVLKNTREANGNNDDVLPVPATFIIGRNNRIRFLHYDPDYRVRLSVREILAHF